MLTKADISEIRKIVREKVKAEVKSIRDELESEINLIRIELSTRINKLEDKIKNFEITAQKTQAETHVLKKRLAKIESDNSYIKRNIKAIASYFNLNLARHKKYLQWLFMKN